MKGFGAIISTTVALTAAGAMGASVGKRTLPAVSVKGNGQFTFRIPILGLPSS
jgi:hypothetical protein